jgi:hypothetical protein
MALPSPGRRLLHFLLLGWGLLAVDALASHWIAEERIEEIEIASAQIETLRRDFRRSVGAPPDAGELAALIRDYVDREILFREALRTGLHRSDPLIRRRLAQNIRFTQAEETGESDPFETALALGMERTDPVVRRRLVQRAERILVASAALAEPGQAELEAYLETHAPAFARSARYRFAHVFVSADRRQATLDRDATQLLAELRHETRNPDEIAALGDPFPLSQQLGPWSAREISKQLGPEFARQMDGLAPGRWTGPVASAYGLHLVWLRERIPPTQPSVHDVRGRLTQAIREQRERRALRAGLDRLRGHYAVRIAPGALEQAAAGAMPARNSAGQESTP